MKLLVLNCGSSSIKYQVLDMPEARCLAKGLVQRIGEPMGRLDQDAGDISITAHIPDHADGLRRAIAALTRGQPPVLQDVTEIRAVGHRVVHGGEAFSDTVLIDDAVITAITENIALAPLHNPPNLEGIRVARELLPGVPQVAVFDTAFHQTMPAHAYLYGLPMELYTQDRIRRYGFHGTSHRYVTERAAARLGRPASEVNLITCHLGNGSSIAAIRAGRSVDTTMGFTPLEGLVMGTRCGDLDPAIVFHLARTKGLSIDAIDTLLNKRSGLLGLSGRSNDMRTLEQAASEGDPAAQQAIDVFCYRVRKTVGAYSAALGRVDAVVFTAGIGENSALVRDKACSGLDALGIRLDTLANASAPRGQESDVSRPDSSTRVLVIPTNEEEMIARDTYAIAQRGAAGSPPGRLPPPT